mgnify:CR=1 FL=1
MKINTLLEQVNLLEMDLSQLRVVSQALKPRVAQRFKLDFNITKHAFDSMIQDVKTDPRRNVDAADFFRSVIKGLEDSEEYRKMMQNKRKEAEMRFTNKRTDLNITVTAKYQQEPTLPEKLHVFNVISVILKKNHGVNDYPGTKIFKFRV